MSKGIFPIDKFERIKTPFYYYDTDLLRETLRTINSEAGKHEGFVVHYAVKANANPKLLRIIREAGMGIDCVSGGEIEAAIRTGFASSKIVYAGVGKSDWEINLGLDNDIFCFNVESIPELEVINELAAARGKIARVAFRLNPNVGAHTHANITTGLAENKFGIDMKDMLKVMEEAQGMQHVKVVGLHFHIGSQILDMGDFQALCNRVNDLQLELEHHRIIVEHINVGGGLGIDYQHPNRVPIPDFKAYFDTYAKKLKLRPGQTLHFELGRAVVAQCGSLITRTLYIKKGAVKKFCIVDAGFTDLIRPALYQAYHKIENISSDKPMTAYDVVGPICESTDVFAKQIDINEAQRGDLLAIRSAGAYGEIMASQYNCRQLPQGYLSDEI
ncbi:MAG: diaminopimelate decarboxylase [Prevotella sp.]|nr:diaminopimelate decarboxylase [Prevotella sp.]